VRQEHLGGVRTTLDILNAEEEVLTAEVRLAAARRDEAVAAFQLLSAVGKLDAAALGLPVDVYDPATDYDAVRGRWFGVDAPARRRPVVEASYDLGRSGRLPSVMPLSAKGYPSTLICRAVADECRRLALIRGRQMGRPAIEVNATDAWDSQGSLLFVGGALHQPGDRLSDRCGGVAAADAGRGRHRRRWYGGDHHIHLAPGIRHLRLPHPGP
jgi:hypothetical protein